MGTCLQLVCPDSSTTTLVSSHGQTGQGFQEQGQHVTSRHVSLHSFQTSEQHGVEACYTMRAEASSAGVRKCSSKAAPHTTRVRGSKHTPKDQLPSTKWGWPVAFCRCLIRHVANESNEMQDIASLNTKRPLYHLCQPFPCRPDKLHLEPCKSPSVLVALGKLTSLFRNILRDSGRDACC